MRRPSRGMAVTVAAGLLLIGGGAYIIGKPYLDTASRGNVDASALSLWNSGGSASVQGAARGTDVNPAAIKKGPSADCTGGATATDAFGLVSFPSLPQYGYAGVAGDGDWNMLHERSMVHWHGSASPGGAGNLIIAFHREPNYQHIDELTSGMMIDVQDRACHVWSYKVTDHWQLDPSAVTQLVQTQGHNITIITCTPFWVDTSRLVWRGTLVAEDGKPVATSS